MGLLYILQGIGKSNKEIIALVKMFKNAKSQRFHCIHSLLQGNVIVQLTNKAFKKSENEISIIKDYRFFL